MPTNTSCRFLAWPLPFFFLGFSLAILVSVVLAGLCESLVLFLWLFSLREQLDAPSKDALSGFIDPSDALYADVVGSCVPSEG